MTEVNDVATQISRYESHDSQPGSFFNAGFKSWGGLLICCRWYLASKRHRRFRESEWRAERVVFEPSFYISASENTKKIYR